MHTTRKRATERSPKAERKRDERMEEGKMKEIKVRVWDDIMNCFHYSDKEHAFSSQASFKRFYVRCEDGQYKWLEGEPQLFTGVKDKNGKEIYEGDLVKASWGYGTGWISGKPEEVTLQGILYADSECTISEDIEVIGNLYENPELMEKTE